MTVENPFKLLPNEIFIQVINFYPKPFLAAVDTTFQSAIYNFIYPNVLKNWEQFIWQNSDRFKNLVQGLSKIDVDECENLCQKSEEFTEIKAETTIIDDPTGFHSNIVHKSTMMLKIKLIYRDFIERAIGHGVENGFKEKQNIEQLQKLNLLPMMQKILDEEDNALIDFYIALYPNKTIEVESSQSKSVLAKKIRQELEFNQTALSQISNLDLSRKKLKMLPKEIRYFKGLRVLTLSRNRLSVLPREIGELKHLQRLVLSHNQLSMLPPEISELKHLKILYLDSNAFQSFPLEIIQLGDLWELYVSSNKLISLPSAINHLKKLKILSIAVNPISELPPQICELDQLERLDIRGTSITEFPKEFDKLQRLPRFQFIR